MKEQAILLAARDNERLLRIESRHNLGGKEFKTIRHEWWTDIEKMNERIYGEDGCVYCTGYAGSTDEQVLEYFNVKSGV